MINNINEIKDCILLDAYPDDEFPNVYNADIILNGRDYTISVSDFVELSCLLYWKESPQAAADLVNLLQTAVVEEVE
ncbi:MAG: hypothetical protein EBU90_27010 [Proteobacteria bacterium]|nr:hypothetical protein [Pseudomonadota bacterium]